jgi:hypothetical protein
VLANGGRTIQNGNLSDLVAAAVEEQAYLSDPHAQVRDTRYYS